MHPLYQWSSSSPLAAYFLAPELLFLYHVFWLGQHMYTGTCLHANDTQTAESLTAARAILNSFLEQFAIDILAAVGASRLHKNGIFQVHC